MAKPIRKYGKGAVSIAVFEKTNDDGSRNEFYSLQKSRKVGDEWKNESVLLSKEQLAIVLEIAGKALSGEEEGASSSPSSSLRRAPRQVLLTETPGAFKEEQPNTEARKEEMPADKDQLQVIVGVR